MGRALTLDEDSKLVVEADTENGTLTVSSDPVALDAWHEVGAAYRGGKLQLEVDGTRYEVPATGSLIRHDEPEIIGSEGAAVRIGDGYQGHVSMFRIIDWSKSPLLSLDGGSDFARTDAVKIVKSGKSFAQVARDLDLTETALREWVRRADADAGERHDVLTTEERQELARLRKENKPLRQEHEILKAGATFFAKESA